MKGAVGFIALLFYACPWATLLSQPLLSFWERESAVFLSLPLGLSKAESPWIL